MSDIMQHLMSLPDEQYKKAVNGLGLDDEMRTGLDKQRAAMRSAAPPISQKDLATLSPEDRAGFEAGYYGQASMPSNAPRKPAPAPQRAPQHRSSPEADRVRALAAQVNAQRQAVVDGIQNKILYANVLGIPDKSLIPMSQLNKAGLSAERTAQGLPYGIDPQSLTPDERAYLGLPAQQAPMASAPMAAFYTGIGAQGRR